MNSEFNPKDILLVFGANIRKTREAQGLGIAELASSIKYDRGCLSLLEYGEQNISWITPNAYFTAFFDRLSVTRLLRIFSQAFSRCFIISQLLELYMLGFSGEVKVADCSDHLLSVDNMNLFHII